MVTIEQRGSTRTTTGAVQEIWTSVAQVWAGISQLAGRELEAVQKLQAEADSKIVIRFLPGVVPEMRVNFLDLTLNASRLFDILSVNDLDERHRTLELVCKERDIKPGAGTIVSGPAVTAAQPYGRKSFTGAIDGVNVIFTLPSNPDPTILQVIRNGAILSSPVDFTLNGNQVTFTLPPKPASGSDPADLIFAYY